MPRGNQKIYVMADREGTIKRWLHLQFDLNPAQVVAITDKTHADKIQGIENATMIMLPTYNDLRGWLDILRMARSRGFTIVYAHGN